ncbi:MAG: GNAT family N-acetyltransferase [bacterium]
MIIRHATINDLDAIAAVEAECFSPAEAATRERFVDRLNHYPNHFWLLILDGQLVSFVNGLVTDNPDLNDEMYSKAELHNERGAWQMIFGVNTVPERRRRGYAGMLIERVIQDARHQGRKGVVLTCKDELVAYYSKFGFVNEGSGKSHHAGIDWNQMRITFASDE